MMLYLCSTIKAENEKRFILMDIYHFFFTPTSGNSQINESQTGSMVHVLFQYDI